MRTVGGGRSGAIKRVVAARDSVAVLTPAENQVGRKGRVGTKGGEEASGLGDSKERG